MSDVVLARRAILILSILTVAGCSTQTAEPERVRAESTPPPTAGAPSTTPEEVPSEPASEPPQSAPPESELGLADRGIWRDLDTRTTLASPEPGRQPRTLLVDRAHGIATLYVADWPIKAYPLSGNVKLQRGPVTLDLRAGDAAELDRLLGPDDLRVLPEGAVPSPGDADDDGIVDPLDVLLGAKKTDLNDATYDPAYVAIPSPGGDVPRTQGVCTDVIVRALRNAGVDLQAEVNADILARPKAYPMVDTANDDIDHRRVRTILPWFERHFETHAVALDDPADPYRPGDIILMDTIERRKGPDHIGIISDERGDDGRYLVINNWDVGATTDALSLLGRIEVTHRFRMASEIDAPIPASATKLIAVSTVDWDAFQAELRRYERDDPRSPWRAVGPPVPAVLGEKGLGWGRGLHGAGAPDGANGPTKQEGDLKSPAGVFALGRTFVTQADELPSAQPVGDTWRCVDDPSSQNYGRVVDAATVTEDWSSAERMKQDAYRIAVVVEHDTSPPSPGAGSCIFLHRWRGADQPVTGCTAVRMSDLRELASWIDPSHTVYVALPAPAWKRLRRAWSLPSMQSR